MPDSNPIPINFEAICKELGASRAVRPSNPNLQWQGTHIEYKDGRSLYLRVSDGRLVISGDWPKGRDGRECHPASYEKENSVTRTTRVTSITLSLTRTPAQIAKEIQRRLLPDYDAIYSVVKTRVEGHNRYEDETQNTLKRLLTVAQVPSDEERFRGQYRDKQTSFSLYHSTHPRFKDRSGLCEVKVSGDSVTLEISTKADEAERIIGLLKVGPPAARQYEDSDTPTEAGWHLWSGPNNFGDSVTPVRTYWIGPNLMVDLPASPTSHARTRKVGACGGWKGKLKL